MYNYRNHSLTAVRPSEAGINPRNQCFQPQICRAQQSIYQLGHLISLQGAEALIITSATWHRADISDGNSHLAVQIMKEENQTLTNCMFLLSVPSSKHKRGQRMRLTVNVSKSEFESSLSPDPRTQQKWIHIILITWGNNSDEAPSRRSSLSPNVLLRDLLEGQDNHG